MSYIYRLLRQVTIIAQSTHTASAIILPNGIADIADAVHTNAHMAATSVGANASEELATRNALMGTTWIILNAGADADNLYLAAKGVIVMGTVMGIVTATVTTPNIPVITTTRQRAATGAANTNS